MPKIIAACCLSVLLAGCAVAPDPVYELSPVAGTGVWYQGRELVAAQAGGARVATRFEESRNGVLVFLVEVANETAEPFTVDPAAFACEDEASGRRVEAVDPEARLRGLAVAREKAEARQASREATDGLFSLISLTADLAGAHADETREERCAREREEAAQEASDEDQRRAFAERQRRLADEQYRWSNDVLRKTTLAAGDAVGGTVHFRLPPAARHVAIVVPVAGGEVRIPYAVTNLLPRRADTGQDVR